MTKIRLLCIAAILLMPAMAIAGSAVVFSNTVGSESCLAWSYTPHGVGGFTQLVLDGVVVRNLSTIDTPDHGFIILCGFPPNTCHRMDAINETDQDYATDVSCTTGLDWDVKLIGIFIFAAWVIFFVLTNRYMDGVFSLLTFIISGIAYRDAFLTSAYLEVAGTTQHINIATIMVLLSLYMLYVSWAAIYDKWKYKRARLAPEKEDKGDYDNS